MSFTSLKEVIGLAIARDIKISELMMESELEFHGGDRSQEDLIALMSDQFDTMVESVRQGTQQLTMAKTGIAGGDGYRLTEYIKKNDCIVEPQALKVVANAMAVNEVNASMGRIVATPTAGSAGILPAVLTNMLDTGKFTKEELVQVMFTSSALGLVIANRASISGAQGGCQAEIGSATAMAAGALVELHGGSPDQVGNAVGLALKNSLGLVCDPVAGLVEIPCITRNGFHALTAMAAADMALAGVVSIIPPDEVIDAMESIGKELPPSLRETGIGGLAGTETGQAIKRQVFGETSLEVASYKSAYEIIGPIMVGPSSSHTAGAVRIGNVARQLLGEEPVEVVFTLMESFAKTYQGHGTDLALIAGVMGYTTQDADISLAKEIADQVGLVYNFLEGDLGNYHPNTVRVHLWGEHKHVELIGSSIGGGKIEINRLNGYRVHFSGERPTLILYHQDQKGSISQVSNFITAHNINISSMSYQRAKIHGPALSIYEMDTRLIRDDVEFLKDHFPFVEDGASVFVQ